MIELASQAHQDYVIEVISNWENANVAPRLNLDVGGEDYSDRIPAGDYAQDGVALTLESNFEGALPLNLYGAPVSLSVSIGGVEVPCMRGLVSLPAPNDDGITTKLLAASAGALADERYPLNERVEFSASRPDYVARQALRRLPYPGSISVDNIDSPLLYFARGHEEGPFEADQGVGDILSKLEEKVSYVFRDEAFGGVKGRVSAGLAQMPNVPDHMRFNAEELLFWVSPSLALEQYAQVIVFKDLPDGSPAFKPAQANVIYTGRKFPPPAGSTLRIAFTGVDSSEAQKRAYLKAGELSRGLYASSPILPFNPLLERTDVFTVFEVKDEDGAFYEREWLHYVESFEQPWDLGFSTKPTCSVTLLSEQMVKAPTLILGLLSGGNNKPLWGEYPIGYFWIDESMPWISEADNGDYFTIDETLSGGVVTQSGDYFTVN